MTSKEIFVYGASGHGKVVADILLAAGVSTLAGFIDDDERRWGSTVLGVPVRGGSEWLQNAAEKRQLSIAMGVGGNNVRRKIAERCLGWNLELVTPIHPAATVSTSARLGEGTVVMAGARINPDAVVGRCAIVNTGAVVEHDTVVGDYAHLSPNSATGGEAYLGSLSHLGLGAVLLPGIRVGQETVVGAGAVVARDLPDRVVALGVPARVWRQLS